MVLTRLLYRVRNAPLETVGRIDWHEALKLIAATLGHAVVSPSRCCRRGSLVAAWEHVATLRAH